MFNLLNNSLWAIIALMLCWRIACLQEEVKQERSWKRHYEVRASMAKVELEAKLKALNRLYWELDDLSSSFGESKRCKKF